RAVQLTDDRDPSSVGSHDFQRALGVVIATALRRTRGQPYRSAGEMGADWAEIHAAFSARLKTRNTSWGQNIWAVLCRRIGPEPQPVADHARLLSAVFRKRIGLSGNEADFDAADDHSAS
ncbi:MAG: hypothetical protein GXP29_04300, partial [Planctomycetes bacterium]|nr:hypothetical protein [Planctomycetota bacterium]